MRKLILVLAFVVLAAIPAMVMASPQPGDPAPPFMLADTAGVMHNFPGDYHGHVIQLFFWESW
jgi:hypothetical protein